MDINIKYDKSSCYHKNLPYIDEHAIYVPVHEFSPEGTNSAYKVLITKEMFVKAYNKWIKGEQDE